MSSPSHAPHIQTNDKPLPRSNSSGSLNSRGGVEHHDDLVPMTHSRRASDAQPTAPTTAPKSSAATASVPTAQQPSASNAASTPAKSATAPTPVASHTEAASIASSPVKTAIAAPLGAPHSAAAQAGLTPLPTGSMQSKAENEALTRSVDWAEPDHLKALHPQEHPQSVMTVIHVGKDQKAFYVPTATLKVRFTCFIGSIHAHVRIAL